LGSLNPELLAAITAAVTQALQAAEPTSQVPQTGAAQVQFVPDPVAQRRTNPPPSSDSSKDGQPGTSGHHTVQNTVASVIEKVISPPEQPGSQRGGDSEKGKGQQKPSKKKPDAQKAAGSQARQLSSASLVADILAPLPVRPQMDLNSLSSEESADEVEPSTDLAGDTLICTVPAPRPLPLAPRPQVGMNTPKSSFPQKKCINMYCKEEKQELKEEIAQLKAEIEECKIKLHESTTER